MNQLLSSVARPIFLVGSPRSGMNLLLWSLGQHRNVMPMTDSKWLGDFSSVLNSVYGAGHSEFSALGITPSDFQQHFGAAVNLLLLREKRLPESANIAEPNPNSTATFSNCKRWSVADPELSFAIPGLIHLFPEAKFITVIRDPDSVVASLKKISLRDGSYFTEQTAYEYWLRTVAACQQAERAYGSDTIRRVHYHQLFSHPEHVLRDCLNFIGEEFCSNCLRPFNGIESPPLTEIAEETGGSSSRAAVARLNADLLAEQNVRHSANAERVAALAKEYTERERERAGGRNAWSLNDRVRELVRSSVPPDATLAVISKGDEDLLDHSGRAAWHFPQSPDGTYAGYHPSDSAEAISQLEILRDRGAGFLVLPASAFWWLDYYHDFRDYLATRCVAIAYQENSGLICDLRRTPREVPECGKYMFPIAYDSGATIKDTDTTKIEIEAIRGAFDRGDLQGSIEKSTRFLQKQPENYVATLTLARAYLLMGQVGDADHLFAKLISNPKHTRRLVPYYHLADITFNGYQDYERVVAVCRQGLALDPSNVRLICQRSLALCELGHSAEALDSINEYLNKHPGDPETSLALSEILRRLGRTDEALAPINSMFASAGYTPVESCDDQRRLNVQFVTAESMPQVHSSRLVSVIMSNYGFSALTEIAICSILRQTYRNLELLIIDDASSDADYAKLATVAASDERISLHRMAHNSGPYLAKNYGLTKAAGHYIAFHDSDDWSHPQRLERQIRAIEKTGSYAATTSCIRIDESSRIMFRGKGAGRLACVSLVFRRAEIMSRLGFFDSVRTSADSEFISRIKAVFGQDSVHRIDVPLLFVTQHTGSLTGGGAFAIDWRGLTGVRLAYHASYLAWHRRIQNEKVDPRIPYPLKVRPFNAPAELVVSETVTRNSAPSSKPQEASSQSG